MLLVYLQTPQFIFVYGWGCFFLNCGLGNQEPIWLTDILSVDLVVCADIHRDNRFLANDQFDGYSITDVDGNGMEPL